MGKIIELLEEIIGHLSASQGRDFKARMDEEKMPKMEEGNPLGEQIADMDGQVDDEIVEGKPKGISVEKVSVLPKDEEGPMDGMFDKGGSSDSEEPTDEELEELLKRASALKNC